MSDDELFDVNCLTKEAIFHKSLRIGALLHDLGAFPFSHTTEESYIIYGEQKNISMKRNFRDDHENLGSYIIKNTNYEKGITHILLKYGISPQQISNLVKGVDTSIISNQILHSEVDCDRMDYLLRDAHYTGLKYGAYDRNYLLHHFNVAKINNQDVLTINSNALHCVEDFLTARFAWYSQVIRSNRGAKFDAIAEVLCSYLLEQNLIIKYEDLLNQIEKDPNQFYMFNDNYFMQNVHKHYVLGSFNKNNKIKACAEAILFQEAPVSLKLEEFTSQLVTHEELTSSNKTYKRAIDKVSEIEQVLKKKGTEKDWIIVDIPKKFIQIVDSVDSIFKKRKSSNVLTERDPVKISYDNGEVKLLTQVENSIIHKLQNLYNFVPNVYCSSSAYELLISEGIVKK